MNFRTVARSVVVPAPRPGVAWVPPASGWTARALACHRLHPQRRTGSCGQSQNWLRSAPPRMEEIVSLLRERGSLETERAVGQGSQEEVPAGIRRVLGERLSRLSQASRRVLTCAALLGRDFEPRFLSNVAGITLQETLAAIQAGVTAGFLRTAQPNPSRFAFAHAIVREAVSAEVGLVQRSRIHARIVDCLEQGVRCGEASPCAGDPAPRGARRGCSGCANADRIRPGGRLAKHRRVRLTLRPPTASK